MSDSAPGISGIHHFSVTVTDIEASLAWYQRLLGADRVPMKFPHYGCEDTGYGELLVEPRSGVIVGLHTNTGNDGQPFDEARTGLDHVALNVASRDELRPGPAGWITSVSNTPGSESARCRFPSPRWCSVTRTTSSSSCSPC